MVGSVPIMANTIWTDGTLGNAGSLPGTAQTILGGNQTLDQIYGSLPAEDSAAMFRIYIADPFNFTATVTPSDTADVASQVIPQIFLFDSAGLPLAGGWAAYVAEATLPGWFGPNVPGYYYLTVDSVGLDPVFTMPDGSVQQLFCATDPTAPSYWACPAGGVGATFDPQNPDPTIPDASTQPISGYQGWGAYNAGPYGTDSFVAGAYVINLTGVSTQVPEPGTVFLLLSGALLLLAGKKLPSVAGFVMRVMNRL
jgi:hypothetical protein